MTTSKRIRNVAFLALLVTLVWAGPITSDRVRAEYYSGEGYCGENFKVMAVYVGHDGDPMPNCAGDAEDWCEENDDGDWIVNNDPILQGEELRYTCSCCTWFDPE
jgi:hypothetical protein